MKKKRGMKMTAILAVMLTAGAAIGLAGCNEINGGNPTLVSIAITSPTAKTVYDLGQDLVFAGMVVTGYYSDGNTKPVEFTPADVTGYEKDKAGDQTLTVIVGGQRAEFTVTVLSAGEAEKAAEEEVEEGGKLWG